MDTTWYDMGFALVSTLYYTTLLSSVNTRTSVRSNATNRCQTTSQGEAQVSRVTVIVLCPFVH